MKATPQLATFVLGIALAIPVIGQTPSPSTVYLSPGDNIQSAVDAAPEGTTFMLAVGLYRGQSVAPKDNDIFTGQGTVILNGSQLLSFKPASQPGLWVAPARADNSFHGECDDAHTLCGYPQDLYIDNRPLMPIATLAELGIGSWFFDRANNQIYLFIDPTGHVVELGMTSDAFHGSASGVQISGLIVEKYGNEAQFGAVGGDRSGSGWIVDHVEIRWNHGTGCNAGPGSTIQNSFIHHNGQLGVATSGTGSYILGNEIAWNNYAGFDPGWESGGSKFWSTTNLTVRSNYVHDNAGAGLWTDTDNVGTLYENNTVVNNTTGILHEVSYDAIIRNNTVKGNGSASTAWLWNAQILIQNSSYVKVYGNTVEVPTSGGNGIALINQNRGRGIQGPWVATDNYVHDNTVTYLGSAGASGIVDDTGGTSATGNRFDYNSYLVTDGGSTHWAWFTWQNWNGLRGLGEETHGTCCN